MDYAELLALASDTTRVGSFDDAQGHGSATNASCGDFCAMSVYIVDGNVIDVRYEAKGCVVSRAAAAILAAAVPCSIDEVRAMDGKAMRTLLNADISPLRERCLTTALVALQNAVNSYDV